MSRSSGRLLAILFAFAVLILLLLILWRISGNQGTALPTPTRSAVALADNPSTPVTPSPPASAPTSRVPVTETPVPTVAAMRGATALYPRRVEEAQVEAILSQMTLEQKIAQMFMIGMPGPTLDGQTQQRLATNGLGGVIFLDRNLAGREQVAALTRALQSQARAGGPGLPLFIGWNHEGGPVLRSDAGMTPFPSAMALGATGNLELARRVGAAVAAEMRSLGVNMNFAPVLDVNSNVSNPVIGLRSFGDNPELVAAMGESFIEGHQNEGVIAVAKHFPGHGGVDVDSHVSLPTLDQALLGLQQVELPPFARAVAQEVGGIMVAHLNIPALDASGRPASLSPAVIDTLLRDQFGYEGVVMTDDIGMGAIRNQYNPREAAVMAVQAGNDLLLTVEAADQFDPMHNAILAAVRDGRIAPERIDAAVRRLLRLKLGYKLASPAPPLPAARWEAHYQLAREVAAASVAVVRDDEGWIPLPGQHVLLLTPTEFNPGSAVGDNRSLLNEALAAAGSHVTELFYLAQDPRDIAEVQGEALNAAPAADAIVVVLWDASLRQYHHGQIAQETLVTDLLATGKPVVAIFGRLPYDTARLPSAPAQITLYGDVEVQVEALGVKLLKP